MSAALARLSVLVAMAWRNLFSARGRNALVGLIMVLGTFLVVLGTSLLDSIEQSMTRSITSSIAGHLQVHSDAARDELALFGGGMMGRPDLGVIADFDVVKRALSEVDNVRAVVPMGTDTAEFQTATELDYAIERVRKARQAGDERRLGDAVARLRSMLALMQEEFEARRTVTSNLAEVDTHLADIRTAQSDAFWARLETAPDEVIEHLDTKIAPLVDENEGYFLQYLGTDVHLFARHFEQFELVAGQMLPKGERGLVMNQKFYDDHLRNLVARDLDKLKDELDRGKRIAKDPLLRNRVERLARQYRRITFQLEPDAAEALAAKLRAELGVEGDNVDTLTQRFLQVTDETFAARYRFFQEQVVPMIRLYLFDIGDTITIRAYTKSGYIKSVNVKVWGTFRFKGLEKSALAGAYSLLDMVTFRDLYGMMTTERAKEVAAIRDSVGLEDLARADAESALFGGDAALETTRESPEAFDELAGVDLAKARAEPAAARYDQSAIDRGIALHAAIVLDDPSRLRETQAAIEAVSKARGLGLKVVDWQQASGIVGQLVALVRGVLWVAIGIIFLVALVIINNTMIMATMERATEIGTMRAIGAQRRFVLLLFLLETVVLGLVAGVLGAGLGAAAVGWLGSAGIPAVSDELVFLFSGERLYPVMGLSNFFGGLLVILVVSVLATFYPAFVATRIQPVVAMAGRE